jgi:beta-carotene hydroxylase
MQSPTQVEPTQVEPTRPRLDELGNDLLVTTPWQRRIDLARPFVGVAAYIVAAALGWWWLTPVLVFLTFVAVVTVAHDVVHGVLGLSRRQTDWALFFTGVVLLESGHAYRTTHLQHHRLFPNEIEDPEGYPAHINMLGAILYGPIFLPKLWVWAFKRQKSHPAQRRWLVVEALVPLAALVAGIVLFTVTPYVLAYFVMALIGSWVYPLLTVYLPHRNFGETPLTQTHTLRGHIIPALFLELTYHLEHHLYPQVPSHRLAELARRLDPFFKAAGVKPTRVP